METAQSETLTTNTDPAKIIYVLYIAGLFIGLSAIIGVMLAYFYQRQCRTKPCPDWLKTHYHFQIRTFWIGLIYLLIGVITSFILIGYAILLFWFIWVLVRTIKGLLSVDKRQAYSNPTSWLF